MNDETLSSGFLGEEILPENETLPELNEFYVSPNGYSQLYLYRRHGKLHVLKCLRPLYRGQPFYEQLLQKEFTIGYTLDHPHVCHTLEWWKTSPAGRGILMEYIDGITLQTFMEQGKLTRPLALKFITEIGEALQYIHSKQLVHKDLKPTNLLITHNGQNVKLIDFGLSDQDDYELLKLPAGTQKYMAPEQLAGQTTLDNRTDIYSLGVIIRDMATHLKDRQLLAIARRCTQIEPHQRYASAAEVIAATRKRILSPVYKLTLFAFICTLFGLLGWYLFTTEKPTTIHAPVYSNTSISPQFQHALLEEQQQLFRKRPLYTTHPHTWPPDSLLLHRRLQHLLDSEFPETTQRTSLHYQRHNLPLELQQLRQTIQP